MYKTFLQHCSRTAVWSLQTTLLLTIAGFVCFAQSSVEYQRALPVSSEEPVRLHVELERAELQILYDRDGEVSIHAVALPAGDAKLADNFFVSTLSIEQAGNDITVRHRTESASADGQPKLRFRIGVPFRTEVRTSLQEGSQTVRGLLGPVDVHAHKGDISASYISKEVHVEIDRGSLDVQVIGEPVLAKVGIGNIAGQRLEKGIQAETNDGDIHLMAVGSSSAKVVSGNGRIEVGGAKGTLTLSTAAGELGVRAVPHNDWKLQSTSGTIRLELPPAVSAQLEASTESGELQVERDDIVKGEKTTNSLTERVGTGGKLIAVHTEKGKIVIR